jgi:hypothetical protein
MLSSVSYGLICDLYVLLYRQWSKSSIEFPPWVWDLSYGAQSYYLYVLFSPQHTTLELPPEEAEDSRQEDQRRKGGGDTTEFEMPQSMRESLKSGDARLNAENPVLMSQQAGALKT